MAELNFALYGPVRVKADFVFSDGDRTATATYDFPVGSLPTEADLAAAANQVRKQVRDQLGDRFDWQFRHDFVRAELAERTGGARFAVPGSGQWQADWAAR